MLRRIFLLSVTLSFVVAAIIISSPRKANAALLAAGTVTATPPAKPDLVISSVVGHQNNLDVNGCALTRVNNDLQVTIQNTGAAPAGVFEVAATGRNNQFQAVPSLAAGASITLTFSDLPADGINQITVDSTGLVAESQEGNNVSNYNSPTLSPLCTSTPTPPGFKTPTATRTGTPVCGLTGKISYDHSGGAGMVNVPLVMANLTGTPNPMVVATTGPYGQYKAGCLMSKSVSAQLSGFTFDPTAVTGSLSVPMFAAFVGVRAGVPTYTNTPMPATATPIGQYTLSGVVVDVTTGAPISGAVVHVYQCNSSQSMQTTTAADGSYSISPSAAILCASSILQVVANGYVTQTAWSFPGDGSAVQTVNVLMQPIATPTLTPVSTNDAHPDLTVLSMGAAASTPACANNPYLAVVVKNQGTGAAGAFTVAFNAATRIVSGLAAGQQITVAFALNDVIAGTNTATADSTSVIAELNESNNSLSGLVAVPGAGPTCTPTSGVSPTFTRTPTITLTPSRTPTPGSGTCAPVNATITAPFTWDGAGTYCWQSSNLGTYINNWNNNSVTINGVNITNVYTAASSYPAKIGGFWYVTYNGSFAWSHFEAK